MNNIIKKNKIRCFYLKKNNKILIKKKTNNKIINFINKYKNFQLSKNIAIYYPLKNEVNLLKLIKKNKKKNFFLPKIISYKKKKIRFIKYKKGKQLIKNKYNILEPINKIKKKKKIEIIFIPFVSFDIFGTRLGKGGKYYDNFLKKNIKKNTEFIGIGWDHQLYKYKLPKNKWDISLHKVITQSNIWNLILK